MKFNINNYVKVKLTDKGREILKNKFDNFPVHADINGEVEEREYTPREEDMDGCSKWQLWELMQAFSGKIYNGCKVPFESEIEIIENQ